MLKTKCSVFIATSLDGYIARKDGGLDWLPGFEPDEDYGYHEFISSVDALIMGRNSFEEVVTFEQWPYSKKVIVLTSRPLGLPAHLSDKVAIMSGPPANIIGRLSKQDLQHFYIDGGKTIQKFMRSGLIDEIIITQIPIILGEGIPLFGPVEDDIKLELAFAKSFENGFVQYKYEVIQ